MMHSPLPWFLGEDAPEPGEWPLFNGSIFSVDKTESEPEPYEVARHVDKQDADLIIRAVNSHADLVAALEDGIMCIEASIYASLLNRCQINQAEEEIANHGTLQKMRAALVKTKGGN